MRQKYRKGDVVWVEAKVRHDETDGDTSLHIDLGNYQNAIVDPEAVTMGLPYYQPGDKALLRSGIFDTTPVVAEVEVISTHEDQVWIKEQDGSTNVVRAKDLERITDKHEEE